VPADTIKRLSIDCKATVLIGDVSRGGRTRGDNQACDHDWGLHEKDMPCGIVEEESGQLRLTFGSSYKTSDCIVDTPSKPGGRRWMRPSRER
jgi:Rhodopirellula transposase DDE domain